MKVLSLILAIAGVAQAARIARQADGSFWWQETTTAHPDEVSVNDTRNYNPSDPLDYDYLVDGPCECVPYYNCQDGNIITDGEGLIDIRVGPGSNTATRNGAPTGQCEGFLEVCCKIPDTAVTPPTPPPSYVPQCGKRNANGVHVRITGDYNHAQFAEFPWMSAVLRKEYIGDKTVNLYLCGGSLIRPNVILTAAHCVSDYQGYTNDLLVRLGEWDTQQTTEVYPHQDIDVGEVIIHPEFNSRSLHFDFALLILQYPAELTPHVDTVCLPSPGQNFENLRCIATGWGKNEFGAEGSYQNVLKLIDLPVVNHHHCQKKLKSTRLGQYFRLDDSFMCAGGELNKDTCKGDGGSPLVCPVIDDYGNTHYYQAGIVAWGIGCGEDQIPGVYADVSHPYVNQWIHDTIDGYVL